MTERTQPTLAGEPSGLIGEIERALEGRGKHFVGGGAHLLLYRAMLMLRKQEHELEAAAALLASPAEPPTLCISCRTQLAGPAVLYSLCEEPCAPAEPDTRYRCPKCKMGWASSRVDRCTLEQCVYDATPSLPQEPKEHP